MRLVLLLFLFPLTLAFPLYFFHLHLPSGDTTLKTFRSLCTFFHHFFSPYTAAWSVVGSGLRLADTAVRPLLWHSDASGFFDKFLHSHALPSPLTHSMVRDATPVLSQYIPCTRVNLCTVPLVLFTRFRLYSSFRVRHFPVSRVNVWGGCGLSPYAFESFRAFPNDF